MFPDPARPSPRSRPAKVPSTAPRRGIDNGLELLLAFGLGVIVGGAMWEPGFWRLLGW
jgi:hypothetical protein